MRHPLQPAETRAEVAPLTGVPRTSRPSGASTSIGGPREAPPTIDVDAQRYRKGCADFAIASICAFDSSSSSVLVSQYNTLPETQPMTWMCSPSSTIL